jgi:hypothetical protein
MAAHDAPAAEEVAPDVEQVHRPAAPVRAAVHAAEQLRHHRLRADPASQRKAVVAIRGDQHVVVAHRPDGADVRRLLSRREMAVAADLRGLVLALGLRLEGPDQQHQLEQPAQLRIVGMRRLHGQSLPRPGGR